MKHNYLYKLLSIILVFLLVLSVGGCSKTADFFDYQKEPETIYKTANKAYMSMGRVKTLNPVISKDKDVYYIDKLIYNSLFKLDENLLPQNDLAESYTYDNDKNKITIKIKNGLKWSNGEPLTANDVKFSVDAYKKASFTKAGLYSDQVANIRSVSVVGDSVIINYMNNDDVSLENLIFPIIPKSDFKNINEVLKQNEKFVPTGSGSYAVDSYNPYSELILKANEYYTGVKPENVLIFKVVPNDGETIHLIEPNLITVAYSEKITRDVDFANLNSNMESYLSNEVDWVGFNMNKMPLSDMKIRQAIAKSIDTKSILESAYYGNGVLCDSIYYPGYWGIKNTGSIYQFDKAKATLLLEKAGYTDLNNDGILEDRYGKEFIIDILVNSNNEPRVAAAEIIKKNLAKIKIKAIITTVEFEKYNSSISNGEFDIYIGGSKMAENYDLRSLLKSYNGNPVGYKNITVDKYLDQLKSGISSEEKIAIYKKLKAILSEEIPYYPLVYKTYGVITSIAFIGKVSPMFNNIYIGAEKWSYKYEEKQTTS
ncbi:MAG: hypothetical protein JJE17_09060, partial [Peptostreptococcaceae bacterium]|nr:hypothetical protein [Peptostreptococcaceae bacterium]